MNGSGLAASNHNISLFPPDGDHCFTLKLHPILPIYMNKMRN